MWSYIYPCRASEKKVVFKEVRDRKEIVESSTCCTIRRVLATDWNHRDQDEHEGCEPLDASTRRTVDPANGHDLTLEVLQL